MRNKIVAASLALVAGLSLTACVSSKREIDPVITNSFDIPGTRMRGFCQGANAFIYTPSRSSGDSDDIEAVIYDDYRCVKGINPEPSTSSKPNADPDGIVDDEN